MKFIGNTLIFLLCSFSLFGQKNITLSGTIFDNTEKEPVIAASIELLNAKDSVFVAGAISSSDGSFSLKSLSKGDYVVRSTYLGYLTLIKPVTLSENQTNVRMDTLYMQSNDILLQEMVVDGKRPEVIVKNDTTEFDAGSFKVTEDAVVEDLLKKLPGMEVDGDGKITFNGKEVKKFLVDGEEFFANDPQIAQKNLPAAMVNKLQVLDRKSEMARMTGFDDGDEETVINLTIREGMKQGTMANALVGGGADLQNDNDFRYQGGAFINHMKNNDNYTLILNTNNNNNMGASDLGASQFGGMRMRRGGGRGVTESSNIMARMDKKFSETTKLNADVRYSNSDRFSDTDVTQTTLSKGLSQMDETKTINNYFSENMAANVSFEWKPDTMNTLIFRPNIQINQSHSDELEYSTRFNYNNMDTIFDSHSTSFNKGQGINFGGTLDYAHKFSKPGRVVSFNLRGSYNDSYSQEKSDWESRRFRDGVYQKNDSILNQRSENDNNTNSYHIATSYVEPLGRNNFLQASYSISGNNTESINSTYDMLEFANYDPLLAITLLQDTATLVSSQSRSTIRTSTQQRMGLSFKAVREKYNYTVGLNVDPSHSLNETYQPSTLAPPVYLNYPHDYEANRLPNVKGDSLISSIKQDIVNFSPVVNFVYTFGQRTNLRIDYDGQTNQPSANQLRDYLDMSRPTDWTQGNPNLKPGYRNNLRATFQKYVAETQLMYNVRLEGAFSVNDITSVTTMQDDGIRLTTYENINGNWNTRARGMFNMPLRNKKFTIGGNTSVSYNNSKSFVNGLENTGKNFSTNGNLRFNYRSDFFDVGISGNGGYSDVTYDVNVDNNQTTYNWGAGGNITLYLPHNFTIESDINWSDRRGYASRYNISQTMWNAAATKQLFNKKYGTGSLKLQIYDLLRSKSDISASTTTNGFRSTRSNIIPSYFMCSFVYKFNAFGGSSARGRGAREDSFRENRSREGGGDRVRSF